MKDNKPANYNVDAESRRNLFKVASAIAAGFGGLTIATEAFADGLPASVSPGLTLSLTGLKHHLLDRLEGNETTSVHLQIPAAFTATDITKILQNCDRLKSIIGSRPQSIVNLLQLVQDGKLRAASTLTQQVWPHWKCRREHMHERPASPDLVYKTRTEL